MGVTLFGDPVLCRYSSRQDRERLLVERGRVWGLSLCRQKPEDPSPHTHTHREQPPAPSPDGIPAQRTYVSGRRFGLTSERDPSAIGRKFSGSTTGPEAGLRRGEQPLQMPAYTVGGSGPGDAAGGAQSTPREKGRVGCTCHEAGRPGPQGGAGAPRCIPPPPRAPGPSGPHQRVNLSLE